MTPFDPWRGLFAASLAAGRTTLAAFERLVEPAARCPPPFAAAEAFATPHRVACELATLRLIDYSAAATGPAALVIAPFALHRATTADFAPGHSLVEALLASGIVRLHLVEWRSAGPADRHATIDSCLADLNVVIDDLGPLPLLGLCQGGLVAAIFAARFPAKVPRLALAGAPVDIAAGESAIADLVARLPPERIAEMVEMNGAVLPGRQVIALWPHADPGEAEIRATLQIGDVAAAGSLIARYRAWNEDVVDLPGAFYRQTVEWIFRENRLAEGRLVALGRIIDLTSVRCPLALIAADKDEIVAPAQLLAMAHRVSTRRGEILVRRVPGRHLSLFLGRHNLGGLWPEIAGFLAGRPPIRTRRT